MTASFVLLFGAIAVSLRADRAGEGILWVLRKVGVLPHPQVEFDGLLDELHARWPLDWDEYSPEAICSMEWKEAEGLRLAA